MFYVSRSLQSWVSTTQSSVLTADFFIGKKPKIGTPRRLGPLIRTLHIVLRKSLAAPPREWPTVYRTYEWLEIPRYTPMAGYSSWPSPINGFKCTYKWLGQPLFWSPKYEQLCTPDGGCQPGVTLPINTNARIDYETLRTQLASVDSTGHLANRTAGPFWTCDESTYANFVYDIFLREAHLVCRSCGAQVLTRSIVVVW